MDKPTVVYTYNEILLSPKGRKEIVTQATTWMHLTDMLSEIDQ